MPWARLPPPPERASPAPPASSQRRPWPPWRPGALARDFASAAALPILHQDTLYGVLSVYAGQADAFDEEEMALLEELAEDVGYALHALEIQAQQESAERRVRELNAELDRRVRERTAALEAANRELEAFNHSVSHDLRAPLRHLNGFLAIVLQDHDAALPEPVRQLVRRAVAACRHMGRLIDALLELSRAGRAEVRRVPTDLAQIARRSFEDMKPQGCDVEFRVGELPRVSCDPLLLRQVFDNLIGNALKFTRPRRPACIEVGALQRAGELVFFLGDNGVGFDPAHLDKLFGVFQRLHSESDFEGTGIGLSVVARIIDKHRGRVWAESTPGRGATFYFTLPDEAGDAARAVA